MYWWLSFVDRSKKPGFLGVALVGPASDIGEAAALAWQKKCNPGGEVAGMVIPKRFWTQLRKSDKNRILTTKEAQTLDDRLKDIVKPKASASKGKHV